MVPQPLLDRRDHGLDHLHARKALRVPLHEVPRRPLGARALEHVLDGLAVGGPLAAVAPVLVRELVLLERVLLARLEALELLLVGEVQPQLHEYRAVPGEHLLEPVDLVVGAPPLLDGGEALDTLDQDPAVPGAVEDRHAAPAGQRGPEAPQPRVAQLVMGRRGVLLHAHVARVELGHEALDRAALAARVPALEYDAQRWAEPLVAVQSGQLEAELLHARLRLLQALLGLLLGEVRSHVEFVQTPHRHSFGVISRPRTRNTASSRATSAIGVFRPANPPSPR